MAVLERFGLEGKVAIVTGASSGLGVTFARALAEAGADVVVGARRAERIEETRRLIEETGRRGLAVRTDVTRVEDCAALVDAAMESFGRVDILINNAGAGGEYHPATEDPPDHFRWMVELNLMGCYWMAQAVSRVMAPGSAVVNISSVMALTTAKMPAAGYSSAKAGLLGLTRDLAAQWGPEKGIRVNAVVLGTFPSEQTAHYSENYKRKVINARIPIGRLGEPEDAAAAVVFLAGDGAAYITGVTLPIDGGVLLT
jgi:NAD(P)-dependent dehydrogenase (short-subunit alcohol dehydrogenase family)